MSTTVRAPLPSNRAKRRPQNAIPLIGWAAHMGATSPGHGLAFSVHVPSLDIYRHITFEMR